MNEKSTRITDGGRISSFIKIAVVIVTLSPLFIDVPFAESSGGKHACDYLNKDEVAKVMNKKVGDIEEQPPNPMGQSICFFDIPEDMAVRFAQLQMMRSGWTKVKGKQFEAPALFENNMSFLDNLQKVEGVGDKAYWGGSGLKLGAGLHVLYKDAYFTVQAATGDSGKNLEKSKELAVIVLNQLK